MKVTILYCGQVVAFLLCVWATPLLASQLWGVDSASRGSIVLNQIDVTTGAVSSTATIGSVLLSTSVQDLTSDPIREPTVLWLIRNSAAGNELISVDPFQQQLLSLTIVHVTDQIHSLAIDPTSGVLYGGSGNSLYRITRSTGDATLVGAGSMAIDKGLGFDTAGNLFGVGGNNTLVAVSKSTGAMNAIGPFSVNSMEDIAARPESGVMYGLSAPTYDLNQINLATAALTKVGASLPRPSGMAFTAFPSSVGDFNGDLVVNAGDYAVWRKTLGTQSTYNAWRSHFGQAAGSSANSITNADATVPEPATLALFLIALALPRPRHRLSQASKKFA